MKIDDIKDPQIRALAWKYRKANKHEKFNKDTVFLGFNWKNTKEGGNFWLGVDKGKPVEITEKMKQDHPEIFLKQEDYFSHFENLSEKELFGLWNEVCDELGEPEDKVDLTNNKQEEMKTKHTLENGTVLEVGKKYWKHHWDDDVSIIFTEILYFGNKKALLRDNNGEEYECCLKYLEDLIPYEEQEEKVKLTKFYYCNCDYDLFYQQIARCKEDLINMGARFVYTEKEFLEKFDVEL